MNDDVHSEEQAHLDETYAKLVRTHEQLTAQLAHTREQAAADIGEAHDEMALDTSADIHTESMADLMSVNNLIDSYSRTATAAENELHHNELLLAQPYFAKVTLRFAKTGKERDIYLGSVGATDQNQRHYIVDWRSPVAETYYNQVNGPTSYVANGRTIAVDLTCRRQFDIERDHLNACFDTTVAIEDPLLLKSLSKGHSEKLQAITATIQREQNEVVRHKDVPVLLVNGIAGSGKTSVLLQRIAYLFYRQRENLDPSQVYLFTPNSVFGSYIDEVLPNMGEKNPRIFTWESFVAARGLTDRSQGLDTTPETLGQLERGLPTLRLESRDFRDLRMGDRILIRASQAQGLIAKYSTIPVGPHLVSLVTEGLHERLDNRIAQIAKSDEFLDEIGTMDPDDQIDVFGHIIDSDDQEELAEAGNVYAQHLYAGLHGQIDDAAWLKLDRIGMRLLGSADLNALEWLYLYILITGNTERKARYVMIDEVQDYTLAQLMVLEHWFPHAHFLLLGDEHQAIYEGTASFPQIRTLFESRRDEVDECRLMTSYRSSPEITGLFCSLLDDAERVQTTSVQREGIEPDIAAYADSDIMRNVLRSLVRSSAEEHTLTAIITSDRGILKWAASYLTDEVKVIHGGEQLPGAGVVLIDLPLAKGLEFDHVIIPDANAATYPDTPLARRQLYTAISRATHKVTLLAQGELSPLLES